MAESVTFGAISYLIVVLQISKKAPRGQAIYRTPMNAITVCRVNAVVDEDGLERFCQVRHAAEIGIVAVAVSCKQRKDGMVKIIAPLRVHAVATSLRRADQAWVVEV